MSNTKVKVETIVRTIMLFVSLINQLLIGYGKEVLPITENQLYTIISTIVTVVIGVWAWWKNNSFTKPAILADEYLEKIK
jgi:SPP1 family holin